MSLREKLNLDQRVTAKDWIALAIIVFAIVLYVNREQDSPEAQAAKERMAVMAKALDKAVRLGDTGLVVAVNDQAIKEFTRYNTDKALAAKAANTPLKYCELAALHILSGVQEVLNTGAWASSSQYEAAAGECK